MIGVSPHHRRNQFKDFRLTGSRVLCGARKILHQVGENRLVRNDLILASPPVHETVDKHYLGTETDPGQGSNRRPVIDRYDQVKGGYFCGCKQLIDAA